MKPPDCLLIKTPKVSLEQVKLTEATKRKIEKILEEQENGHLLREVGLKPKYRYLFFGAAGSGKTILAEALAHYLNKTLYIFNLETISSTDPDGATKTVMDAFRFINSSSDIFLFDEFDAIASSRNGDSSTAARRTSNSLLIAFESIKSHAILICATNFISTIDPAFRRRFDTICKFEPPTIDEREEMIRSTLKKYKKSAAEGDIKEATKATEGLSYHETEELALSAIKTSILKGENAVFLIPEIPVAYERRNAFKQEND